MIDLVKALIFALNYRFSSFQKQKISTQNLYFICTSRTKPILSKLLYIKLKNKIKLLICTRTQKFSPSLRKITIERKSFDCFKYNFLKNYKYKTNKLGDLLLANLESRYKINKTKQT